MVNCGEVHHLVPLQAYLGIMGMPGMTAYVGLLDIGKPKAGGTVFVSAAAGAVGMVVCQIAKLKGCRVVGSAGSAAKVQWLRDVAGIDVALNYKEVTSFDRLLVDPASTCGFALAYATYDVRTFCVQHRPGVRPI